MVITVVVTALIAFAAVAIATAAGAHAPNRARRVKGGITRTWRAGDIRARAGWCTAAVLLLCATLTLVAAEWAQSVEEPRTALALTGAAAVLGIAGVVLLRRRHAHARVAWQRRELMLADSRVPELHLLHVYAIEYTAPVGQRCWTIDIANGARVDTWFSRQWFPVGAVVLCDIGPDRTYRGLCYLTAKELAAADRHGRHLDRDESPLGSRRASARPGVDVVAEAEAILRGGGKD